MKSRKYNIWFALIYEVLSGIKVHYRKLRYKGLINIILAKCKHDWVLWKIETTLEPIERQAEEIRQSWEKQDPPRFYVVEHEPDGSKAQELLGGAMEIKSTFKRD